MRWAAAVAVLDLAKARALDGLAAAAITLVALDAVRLVQRRVARALSPMPVDGLTTVPQ